MTTSAPLIPGALEKLFPRAAGYWSGNKTEPEKPTLPTEEKKKVSESSSSGSASSSTSASSSGSASSSSSESSSSSVSSSVSSVSSSSSDSESSSSVVSSVSSSASSNSDSDDSSDSSSSSEKVLKEKPKQSTTTTTTTTTTPSTTSNKRKATQEPVESPPTKRTRTDPEAQAPIKTTYSHNQPLQPLSKVFVQNLPFTITDDDIYQLFGNATAIQRIQSHTTNQFRGRAVISFATNDEAIDAVVNFNGTPVEGKTIGVSMYKPPPKPEGCRQIHLAPVPNTVTEEEMRSLLEDCGNIEQVEFFQNPRSASRFGSAIITFDVTESADKAVEKGQNAGLQFHRWPVTINYATPKNKNNKEQPVRAPKQQREISEKPEGCMTVWLGNLPFDVEEEDVHTAFQDCGQVTGIRWVEKNGKFIGTCYVDFSTTEAPDRAVRRGQAGLRVKGRKVQVDYDVGR